MVLEWPGGNPEVVKTTVDVSGAKIGEIAGDPAADLSGGNLLLALFRQSLVLTVIFYKAEGGIVAHCLECDLVDVQPTEREALQSIHRLMEAYLQYAVDNNNWAFFFNPAPRAIWARAAIAMADGTLKSATPPIRTLKIEDGPAIDIHINYWTIS